jgi:flagellar biosynthesis protein
VSHSDDSGDGRPDAIAVALAYDPGRDRAPKVVAGGRGAIAEQILEIAFANDVKVREDPDLAQLLSTIDVDSPIPVAAFAAVAEILVYVYRVNGAMPDGLGEAAEPGESPT